MRMPVQVHLVAFSHLWFYKSAVRFRDRHVTRASSRIPSEEAGRKSERHSGDWGLYSRWILVCVLASGRAQETSGVE
eukprot:1348739-Amphidinium_carterae.1